MEEGRSVWVWIPVIPGPDGLSTHLKPCSGNGEELSQGPWNILAMSHAYFTSYPVFSRFELFHIPVLPSPTHCPLSLRRPDSSGWDSQLSSYRTGCLHVSVGFSCPPRWPCLLPKAKSSIWARSPPPGPWLTTLLCSAVSPRFLTLPSQSLCSHHPRWLSSLYVFLYFFTNSSGCAECNKTPLRSWRCNIETCNGHVQEFLSNRCPKCRLLNCLGWIFQLYKKCHTALQSSCANLLSAQSCMNTCFLLTSWVLGWSHTLVFANGREMKSHRFLSLFTCDLEHLLEGLLAVPLLWVAYLYSLTICSWLSCFFLMAL